MDDADARMFSKSTVCLCRARSLPAGGYADDALRMMLKVRPMSRAFTKNDITE